MPPSAPKVERKKRMLCALALPAVLSPCIASATLGETEASVQANAARVQGSLKVMDRPVYRLHEIQLPSGTVVREYAGLNGMVFAVTWQGPAIPNLRETLGRYFEDYLAAAKANRLDHHHLSAAQNDLVIQANGHMRAFSGRAYLPLAVPAGVDLGDIR